MPASDLRVLLPLTGALGRTPTVEEIYGAALDVEPFVVPDVTADASLSAYLAAGYDAYCPKPVDARELLEAAAHVLASAPKS